jgi:hypothetical protein
MPHAPTGDARARVASQWNDLFVRGGTAKETRTRLFCCLCLLLMPWLCIGCVFSGRIETDFTSGSFRKPGVEFQGAREADRGPEDRDGPFERSARLDWLHSRRSYRVGVQEGLPGVHRRSCGNLRRDFGIWRHTRTADLAGPC